MRKTAGICVLGLLLATSVAWSGGAGVGEMAPDVTLQDLDGNEVTLSKIDGVRVLEWVNPDCPFVKRHYQAGTMKGMAATYATRGVTWLTINSTHYMDREANREFVKAYGLTQTILMDPSGAVGHTYGAATTPHMFVIDGSGTIVYAGAIDDDPRGTKGDEATNYVEAALDETLAGKPVTTAETKPYGCSVKYAK